MVEGVVGGVDLGEFFGGKGADIGVEVGVAVGVVAQGERAVGAFDLIG